MLFVIRRQISEAQQAEAASALVRDEAQGHLGDNSTTGVHVATPGVAVVWHDAPTDREPRLEVSKSTELHCSDERILPGYSLRKLSEDHFSNSPSDFSPSHTRHSSPD